MKSPLPERFSDEEWAELQTRWRKQISEDAAKVRDYKPHIDTKPRKAESRGGGARQPVDGDALRNRLESEEIPTRLG